MPSSHTAAARCHWFSVLAAALDPRSAPRLALLFLEGGPGPGPADGHELDPGGRAEPGVPALLHDGVGHRKASGPHRRPPGPRGDEAAGGGAGRLCSDRSTHRRVAAASERERMDESGTMTSSEEGNGCHPS